MKIRNLVAAAAALAVGLGSASALADAGQAHEKRTIGVPGQKAKAARTIRIEMHDNYFEPERVAVKAGETVRFVVVNKGELLHEFNIASPEMHAEHQKEMETMLEHGMITPTGIDEGMMKMDHGGAGAMKHDHPNSVLLEPGKTGEIVWTFPAAAELEFACNVPGHYQAGMVGPVEIRR